MATTPSPPPSPCYSLRAVARGPATARTAALYTFARSLALAALAAGAFFAGSVGFLAAVTGATLLVQAVDGCVGLWGKSLPRAAGPFLMALLHGAGLLALLPLL